MITGLYEESMRGTTGFCEFAQLLAV